MRGYTLGDVAVAEASGVVVGDGNNAMFGLGSYRDVGCAISSRCTECPLIACKEDFASGAGRPPMDEAIAASWAAGLRDPRFAQLYTGPRSHIPPDVEAPGGRRAKHERAATVRRLRAEGLTLQAVADRLNLHYTTVQRICAG